MHREQRVTLIVREKSKPDHDWNYAACRRQSVAFLDSMPVLRFAIKASVTDNGLDVGCVIIDRASAAEQFLDLLTDLPSEYAGDVLCIRDDGSGIMSAMARGGDRVLYALKPFDVRFYLEAHNLVTARVAMELSA